MSLRFTKMHALGNDFILIDARESIPEGLTELSRRLCRRRLGIGADQLLLLLKSDIGDLRMRIFNSDGTEVEMCGNGIRCLAKYIWDKGISEKDTLNIETLAGIIKPSKAGSLIRVDMGAPILEGKEIPVNIEGRVMDYPLKIDDRVFNITCVSMGNPHTVIFMQDVSEFPISHYGPLIENHPLFPKRTNVEFIEVLTPISIKMRVWERGAGETPACGTGASASVVAGSLKGVIERNVTVQLPYGDLLIGWAMDSHVYMTGPAEEVFEGWINDS